MPKTIFTVSFFSFTVILMYIQFPLKLLSYLMYWVQALNLALKETTLFFTLTFYCTIE